MWTAAPGGGEGGYSYMKVVYICRSESDNEGGGLKERPHWKWGRVWLSERLLTEKQGDFGTKNNKEMYIFKRGGGVFWSSPGRKKVEQTNVYLWKVVSFGAVEVEKVESLGAVQAEKWGGRAFGRPYCPDMGEPSHPPPPHTPGRGSKAISFVVTKWEDHSARENRTNIKHRDTKKGTQSHTNIQRP